MRHLMLLASCVLLIACSESSPPSRTFTTTLGGLEVEVVSDPARVIVRDGDRVLFDGAPGEASTVDGGPPYGFAAFRTGAAHIEFLAGAFRIEEASAEAWRTVAELAVEEDEGGLTLDLLDDGGDRLGIGRIAAAGPGELTLTLTADDPSLDRASVAFGCAADEHFLGLGAQSFDVDHRGQSVPLWVSEGGITKRSDDEYVGAWMLEGRRHTTHAPIPVYLSSRGYALALETSRYATMTFCKEREDAVRLEAWEGAVALRIFAGRSPLEAIDRLTAWTGRPARPPAFAFAPWVDAIFGSANVRRIAARLRTVGVPAAVIWTEDWRGGGDYAYGYALDEDWRVDRDLYPDFEQLADDLHALGYKFLTYQSV